MENAMINQLCGGFSSIERPRPMLLRIVAAGYGEVLLTCARRLLDNNLALTRFPRVQALPDLSPYVLQSRHMVRTLDDNRLKDDEMLHVSPLLTNSL